MSAAIQTNHRPTYDQLRAQGAAQEREACVEYLRDVIHGVEQMAKRGRLPAMEADTLKRRLEAVADGIVAGLHR